jgi:glutamyl-tRNA synthetase
MAGFFNYTSAMPNHPVVTRFAPSPTGLFHAGSYRTALFAYIFARQHDGKFILRIEDTDRVRSKKEYEENIVESLSWMGLDYDAMYRQSDRGEIYKKYIGKLIDSGHAYLSDEKIRNSNVEIRSKPEIQSPKLASTKLRTEVIRFRNPNKKVVFDDLIRGRIEFDTTELGDFVIAKSLDEPVFHLVNVVDDYEMGMTHIIRGEDHISNTPRQIIIYEAIGATVPKFAHIPLLLAPDRSKLSKRHGALPMTDYRGRGYMPAAMVNYMALLGWHPADDRELLSLKEIIKEFSLERVQKSGAIFDENKLKWFNHEYIAKLSDGDFASQASAFVPEWIASSSPVFKRCISLLREKISAFGEIARLFEAGGELGFVHALAAYETASLLWKKNPERQSARAHLEEAQRLMAAIPDSSFTADAIKAAVWNYAETAGKGDVLWPLRMALTGQEKSPDPFTSAYILGREEALKRVGMAIEKLRAD